MIARVRGPTFRAASARSRLKWCGLTSTQTGVAPRRATEPAVAKKVKDGRSTSSPSPTSSAMSARSSASVPEETPSACFTPRKAAQSFSKASRRGPMMNWFDRSTSRKAASNWGSSARFCGPRSRSGTVVMARWASPTVDADGQHHSAARRERHNRNNPPKASGKVQNCPAVRPRIWPSSASRKASQTMRATA